MLFQKGDDGVWRYLSIGDGAEAPLRTVDLLLPLSVIYEGLTLDPDPASGNDPVVPSAG